MLSCSSRKESRRRLLTGSGSPTSSRKSKKSYYKRVLLIKCGVTLIGICCVANTVANEPMLQSLMDLQDHVSQDNTVNCSPWEVDMDPWWQAHPDWEAFGENTTHTCFRPIAHVEQAKYLREFSRACTAGWVDRLLTGFGIRRSSSSASSSSDPEGYFLPLSANLHSKCAQLQTHWQSPQTKWKSNLQKKLKDPKDAWFYSYSTRPRQRIRHLVVQQIQKETPVLPQQHTQDCTWIKVHRGENKPLVPLAQYLQAGSVAPDSLVFLWTNDYLAVQEAEWLHPKHHWMFWNQPSAPVKEQEQLLNLLSELQLAQQCSTGVLLPEDTWASTILRTSSLIRQQPVVTVSPRMSTSTAKEIQAQVEQAQEQKQQEELPPQHHANQEMKHKKDDIARDVIKMMQESKRKHEEGDNNKPDLFQSFGPVKTSGRGILKETPAPATMAPTPPAEDLVLPTWFVEYAQWHKQQLEILHNMKDPAERFNTPTIKYLIIRCPKWQEQCGGTADRLQTLPLMLRYGATFQRLVFYHWERPHPLEEFLVPTPLGINWTLPTWLDQELERRDTEDRQAQIDAKVMIKNRAGVNLARTEQNQTVLYLFNFKSGASQIYNFLKKENLELHKDQQEKDDPPFEKAYHSLWHANFRPSPPVQALIDQQMQDLNLTPNEYTSFHFRSMYLGDESTSVDNIVKAANCALRMARNNSTIFVATDSKAATETAVSYIHKIQRRAVTRELGDNDQEPLHLDRGHNFLQGKKEAVATQPSDYYDTFVDMYLMQMAKCIVYGRGGFGSWANLISKDFTCAHNYFYNRGYHFDQNNCPVPPLPELQTALPEDNSKPLALAKDTPKEYKDEVYCQWDPKDRTKCKSQLMDHVCGGGASTSQKDTPNQQLGSRVLVLGDATFGFSFLSKYVQHRLKYATKLNICGRGNKKDLQCQWKSAERCNNRRFYGFSDHVLNKRNEPESLPQWLAEPKLGMEGPVENGLSQKGCSDCAGCKSGLLSCSVLDENNACLEDTQPPNYHGFQGGYINVEFARDVILQTEHHNTTQENIALFLKQEYNSPELVEAFGKPFCFVNTGYHDVLIPGISQENYVENVRWYLQLLQPQCQYMIWVSTTAPLSDDNSPKAQTRLEWNDAVRSMLATTSFGGHRIPFLDVYPASMSFEHNNNVHMAAHWYRALGDFLGDIVEGCASSQLGSKETVDSGSDTTSIVSPLNGPESILQNNQISLGQLSPETDNKNEAYCRWDPTNRTQCQEVLLPHMCPPGEEQNNTAPEIGKARVLAFGDSTFGFNFLSKYIRHRLKFATKMSVCSPTGSGSTNKTSLECNWKNAERCSNRQFFGFQDTFEGSDSIAPQWMAHPEAAREGPAEFGLGRPGCTDCAGCKSGFLSCSIVNKSGGEVSNACQEDAQPSDYRGYQGGYINVEFARDVILQTEHYNTSQENIALFLKRDYNSPELVKAFGRPFCFVNTGHHDVLIKGITKDTYAENVRWYLELLQPHCSHIVWVSVTAPMSNERTQKIEGSLEWSEAVRHMLATTDFGGRKIPFLDVYHASMNFTHKDNIHMSQDWYRALGDFLGDLVEGCVHPHN